MSQNWQSGVAATRRTRRRQNRREIMLPFILGLVALIVLILLLAFLPRPGAANFVANLLGTLFFLCPLALCLFPFTILLVAAVYGLGRVNERAARPLIGLERLSIRANQLFEHYGKRIAERTIQLRSAYEQFDRVVVSKLEPDDPSHTSTGKSNHD